MPVLEEATRLQALAHTLDGGRHTFLIAGSTAILFYIQAALDVANPQQRTELYAVLNSLQKPSDLDFKYVGTGERPFEDAVQKRSSGGGGFSFALQTVFDYDIETCPEYVDLDVFRCCAPIDEDVTFTKRGSSLFDAVDFTELPARRRRGNAQGVAETLFGGAQVLGFEELHQFYTTYDRGTTNMGKRRALEVLAEVLV